MLGRIVKLIKDLTIARGVDTPDTVWLMTYRPSPRLSSSVTGAASQPACEATHEPCRRSVSRRIADVRKLAAKLRSLFQPQSLPERNYRAPRSAPGPPAALAIAHR